MQPIENYLFELTFEDGTTERLQCEKIDSKWQFDDFTINEAYISQVVDELKKENEHLQSVIVYKVEGVYRWLSC